LIAPKEPDDAVFMDLEKEGDCLVEQRAGGAAAHGV
jgi:hypothetical protein